MRRPTAPLVRCALALGLLLAAVGCGGPEKERVTIMVPWSGTEFKAFYSVIEAFEDRNPGIDVEPQVTRALTQQLDAAVAAEAAPDLAVLPSVGAISEYRKDRALRPLAVDTAAYPEPFRELAMEGGDVYAVPVKADVKSLVWYDATRAAPPPPRTWTALRARPESWCLGLESGPTSGWPGADWIADLLLAEAGADTYEAWVSGDLKWDSTPVEEAWRAWGDLIESAPAGAATRAFSEATDGMTDNSCSLGHGALSAMGFEPDRVTPGRYTYVTPSPDRVLEVSADFVGKFTGNNDSADKLISYLASEQAQQAWVDAPGFALSANRKVTAYGNDTQERIAGMLRSGYTLCFSAADAMDPDVSAAFYRAVLEYANGRELPALLEALNKVQRAMRDSPPPTPLCGTPNHA
ncbi:ABC transporter substrate-binding protein [Streptomyces sp. NBC_01017]|uniref:ABC transporter substrate-binding protein n=1 Tax=Streptomyces sp. NBC_01017 TaxID=2903721 RepID=UPI00386785C8|nr:ABC transporter substrate-binding protein [Streptomyces sp. NBC_01017]